jgi:L-alanine-DL-glutamate epimerase-like enolase superfamily enzyme
MKIDGISVHEVDLPFAHAYGGSANPLTSLTTVLIEVRDVEGRSGWGEAAVYSGYTVETLEEAKAYWERTAEALLGMCATQAITHLSAHFSRFPFAAAAIVTAIEMMTSHPVLMRPRQPVKIPLLAPLYSRDIDGVEAEIESLLEQGYRTVKMKLGVDVVHEVARVREAQRVGNGRVKLRLDANQCYSREEALALVRGLEPEAIELLEQPCAAGDWESAVAIKKAANVPLMLDESIYGPEDIARTAELDAADFVKLKLMKFSSIDRLLDGLNQAHKLGLQTVLGNGVASDLGCWMEACVARFAMNNDGEMNGFLKPQISLFETPMAYHEGHIILTPDFQPKICRDTLRSHEVWGKQVGRQ